MASIAGLKRRLGEFRPRIVPTFVPYLTPRPSPVGEIDEDLEIILIDDPDHPVLEKLVTGRQLKVTRKLIRAGTLRVMVGLKDGEPIARIWESTASVKGFFDGIPRIKLAPDETFMFDLFVAPEYRRGAVAHTMADSYFRMYPPGAGKVNYVYSDLYYDNAPSVLWHHATGFQIAQTVNMLHIGPGPMIKWRIPFSDMPRFGPMSRRGRHTDPSKEVFGPPLLP